MNSKIETALSPFIALLPFCLALLLMAAGSPASQVLRYREQTGDDTITFSWQAERKQDRVTVTQQQGDEVYSSINTPEGVTLSWQYVKQPDTKVRAERVGDHLHFSGQLNGQPFDKILAIDSRPWYQNLSFSLHRMVAQQQQATSFWTVRPDTMEVLPMQAEQAGSGEIDCGDGSSLVADKVILRPEGPLSLLWQAEYWFRQGDSSFLQYKGTHGPPGTAQTRICLISP